jgi:hypothetical protein
MPCHVQLRRNPDHVEVEYVDTVPGTELRETAARIMALCREAGTPRVLADCSRMGGGHSLTDLYNLAEWLAANHPTYPVREAVLVPTTPTLPENFQFWEDICQNRGHVVRTFTAREEAMDWLLARPDSAPPK